MSWKDHKPKYPKKYCKKCGQELILGLNQYMDCKHDGKTPRKPTVSWLDLMEEEFEKIQPT